MCQFNEVTIEEEDTGSPVKCPVTTRLVLETDEDTKEPIIEVDKKLIRKLKPHQVDGVYLFTELKCIIYLFDCLPFSVLTLLVGDGRASGLL